MKDFIKFLRLDSLCGQLVAIAVLSLAALQCVNYYAVYSIQQSYAGEFLAVGTGRAARSRSRSASAPPKLPSGRRRQIITNPCSRARP